MVRVEGLATVCFVLMLGMVMVGVSMFAVGSQATCPDVWSDDEFEYACKDCSVCVTRHKDVMVWWECCWWSLGAAS